MSGGNWEGLAIESLIAAAPGHADARVFRTAAGAEIDLVVYGGAERFPLAEGVEAVPLVDLCEELSAA